MIKVISHPSLALIKYWGKENELLNTAATPSLALNLEALTTKTQVSFAEQDEVIVSEKKVNPTRFAPFFDHLRKRLDTDAHFLVHSENNFPTSSGLASSSSGFSALAFGCAKLLNKETPLSLISELARLGSASSARAIFPGFTALREGVLEATPLFPETYWPSLRVLIAIVSSQEKPFSSREAMKRTQLTSPFYPEWVNTSKVLFKQALEALEKRDLKTLGGLMRQSTFSMFATMLGANPPMIYWMPETCGLFHTLEKLRQEGLPVFETCDAGPQVKMLVEEKDLSTLENALRKKHPEVTLISSRIGGGTREV